MEKKKLLMSNPLVSVIIPVYNGEQYLAGAIESIHQQNYEPIEIIIVDDGSTDKTAQIAKDIKGNVKYNYQTNKGPAAARNKGIQLAQGEFLAFLDVDDLWTLDKLTTQVQYIMQHPEIQYTIARIKYFLEPGYAPPAGFRKELLKGTHVGRLIGTLVSRKSIVEKVGMFNTTLSTAEDVDWFSRANDQQVTMALIPKVLMHKRVHCSNISQNVDENNRNLLKTLRKSVHRKKTDSTSL